MKQTTEEQIRLTKQQKDLLREMVHIGHERRFNMRNLDEEERTSLLGKIQRIASKLEPHGVMLKQDPRNDEFFFEFKELYSAGFHDLIEPEKTDDTVSVYVAPGHSGFGTTLIDPLVAEGIHVFLKYNSPRLHGEFLSPQSYLERADAVFMIGGLQPKIPKTVGNKKANKAGNVMARLRPEEMSPERRDREDRRLEALVDSPHISTNVANRYRDEVYGIITDLDDATAKSRNTLDEMLGGFQGQLFYQPDSADADNRELIYKQLKEEIGEKIKYVNGLRKEITSLTKKIRSQEGEMVVQGMRRDYVQAAEPFMTKELLDTVLGNRVLDESIEPSYKDLFKSYDLWLRQEYDEGDPQFASMTETEREEFNERYQAKIWNWLLENPREPAHRRVFEDVFWSYIQDVQHEFDDFGVDWNSTYFTNMTDDEADEFKRKYIGEVEGTILRSLDIVRTMYGLGWQEHQANARQDKAEGVVRDARVRQNDAEDEIASGLDFLGMLGWIDEKPLNKADLSDDRLLKIRADEIMENMYTEAAGDLDMRVLEDGVSHVDVNGFSFEVEYTAKNPEGDSKMRDVMNRIHERSESDEFIPDVSLFGPTTSFDYEIELKRPQMRSHGPSLRYDRKGQPVRIIQLSNLYTSDVVKQFRETTREEERDSTSPKQLSSGCVTVHVIPKDGSSDYILPISSDVLKNLALNERTIDDLTKKLESSRSAKNKQMLRKEIKKHEAKRMYNPTIQVVTTHDHHNGDGDPWWEASSYMNRDAVADYLTQHAPHPDILVTSELLDGAQTIRGIELAAQNHTFTKSQYQRTLENLKRDRSLTPSHREELLEELAAMQVEGASLASTPTQAQEMKESKFGNYYRNTLINGTDVLQPTGDHEGRTSNHRGDESRQIRNVFNEVYIDPVTGEKRNLARQIYVGNDNQVTNHIFYRGEGKLNGLNIYATHKIAGDPLKSVRNIGLDEWLILGGHTHHAKVQNAGGKTVVIPPGLVPAYDYVYDKGMHPGLQGTAILECAEQDDTLYKHVVGIDMSNNAAFEQLAEFNYRQNLRQELVENYVAPM